MRGECRYAKETLQSIIRDIGHEFSLCIPHSELSQSVKDMINAVVPKAVVRYLDAGGFTLAEALNLAVSTSEKEFILRIDSDDKVVEGRTLKQYQFLMENDNTAVVGSQIVFIDENSKHLGKSNYSVKTFSLEFGFGCRIAHPSVMFRRSQIISVGNYQEICNLRGRSICEDYDLWLRVIEKYRIMILDEHLTEYRIHTRQNTQKYEAEIFLCSLILRSRKILGSTRNQVEIEDLRLESIRFKGIVNQMKNLETPESRVWLLDLSIFTVKKYLALTSDLSNDRVLRGIKNLNLWFFAFGYVLKNRGDYEREITIFRSMINPEG